MSQWVDTQISRIRAAQAKPVVVVLDGAGLLSDDALRAIGSWATATTWWELRCAWERLGRDAAWEERVVIHTVGAAADPSDVPTDIRTRADTVEISWPVPPAWRSLFADLLPDGSADVLIDAVAAGRPPAEVIERLWHVAIPCGFEGGELAAVAQLRARRTLPDAAWQVVAEALQTPLAIGLAHQPPHVAPVRRRWERWLGGRADDAIEEAGPAMLNLVGAGLLPAPAAMPPNAPAWLRPAAGDLDHASRAAELLDRPPFENAATSVAEWSALASWFGQVRASLSRAPSADAAIKAHARARAEELDGAFLPWLQRQYGPLLQSAASPPVTLNKVTPFLARRLDEVPRVLLVILDGVGYAQWHVIRELVSISPVQEHSCLALLPTETAISRQGLVAGMTPDDFAETFTTTRKEELRWRSFWHEEGLSDPDIKYYRVDGRLDEHVILSHMYRAVTVIISAIDMLMHGSGLLDDVQLAAQLAPWCEQGFLRSLVDDAADQGFETWLTADHGNVVADGGSTPRGGLNVERAGTRFRLYRSERQRDADASFGTAWTPPRLPPNVFALFAPGRRAFHHGHPRVTHGGLSFEEVFVPLVRVT